MFEHADKKVIIIGAGPAGLTAAYELCKASVESIVLQKDTAIGGLSRTVNYKGYRFDIGGHRFFTKVKAVEDMWHEVLPDGDFFHQKRLSRIYFNKSYFYYPLRPSNALFGLGLWNSARDRFLRLAGLPGNALQLHYGFSRRRISPIGRGFRQSRQLLWS